MSLFILSKSSNFDGHRDRTWLQNIIPASRLQNHKFAPNQTPNAQANRVATLETFEMLKQRAVPLSNYITNSAKTKPFAKLLKCSSNWVVLAGV